MSAEHSPNHPQPTVMETWEEIRRYSRPARIGIHSCLPDGRPLIAVFAGNLESGSFKERGALTKMLQLQREGRSEATLYSAGNHLLGAALGARALGFRLHGFVPWYAPQIKIDKSIELGEGNVTVTRVDGDLEAAKQAMLKHAKRQRASVMEPFDDEVVARGQGTLLYELLSQVPDIQHVILPEGGGGLHAGSIQTVHELETETVVHGAKLSAEQELCEGSYVNHLGDVALRARRAHPNLWDETLVVDPSDVGAMIELEDAARHEQAAAMGDAAYDGFPEATALLGAAAAHRYYRELEGNVAVIITGSNADQAKLDKLHGYYQDLRGSNLKPSLHVASGFQLRQPLAG